MKPELLTLRDTLDPVTLITYNFNRTSRNFSRLHTHEFFEITIVTAGEVCHHINGRMVQAPANTLLLIRPHDAHCITGGNDADFEYVNIAFSESLLSRLLEYLDNGDSVSSIVSPAMPAAIRLTANETAAYRRSLEQLSLIPRADVERIKTCSRRLIADLIARCHICAPIENACPHHWFNQLLDELNRPENFSRGVAYLSERSGKSMSYISRMFKLYIGATPTDYVNSLRMNYCANLLAHSDAPIIEIAMDAGFNNLSHFYHLFKQEYGVTPNKYRAMNATTFG